jgi:hypothetical protein
MTWLKRTLQDADPVAHEPPLAQADVQRMRRAVLTAAEASPSRVTLRRSAAWAVAAAAILATVVGAGRWSDAVRQEAQAPPSEGRETAPRQLQFATPGGTRVIWVFNPDFKQ